MDRDKENGLLWTRTILECYNKLPRMAHSLEKAGEALIKSGLSGGSMACGYTTEELFERMIEINYRKTGIINLKVLVEQGLRRIIPEFANVLKARFFLNLDAESIAERESVNKRTVFRRIERGLDKLYGVFCHLGFDGKRLDREYIDEPLILNEKERIRNKLSLSESNVYSKSS